jgi:hypothetical protein
MRSWEIIADRLSKAGWSLGWVSAVDSEDRTIWIVDAHRDDARRFIVHADEKLTAFLELERQALIVTFYLESVHADSSGDALLRVELAILQCLRGNVADSEFDLAMRRVLGEALHEN